MGNDIHYVEMVTPEVDATCATLASIHGLDFAGPVADLGNAMVAEAPDGSTVAVRAPMHDQEEPVTRNYRRVDDLEAAVASAQAGGGEIALPPMAMGERGRIAIYFQGGVQYGLWELP